MNTTAAGSPNPLEAHRFWPPASAMILMSVLAAAGVFGIAMTVFNGEWIAAVIFVAILAYPVFSFGWIDVEHGQITQGRLFGGRTVNSSEIASIDLDFVKTKSTKWWFPVLVLNDGDEMKLATLKSVSKKKTEQKARIIQKLLNGNSTPQPAAQELELFS